MEGWPLLRVVVHNTEVVGGKSFKHCRVLFVERYFLDVFNTWWVVMWMATEFCRGAGTFWFRERPVPELISPRNLLRLVR